MPRKISPEEVNLKIQRSQLVELFFALEAKILSIQEDVAKINELLTDPKMKVYEKAGMVEVRKIGRQRVSVLDNVGIGKGKILTVREVGDILGLAPKTVRRWIKAGKISAIKFPGSGGGWRIRHEQLDEWLKKRSIRAYRF